MAIDKIKDRVFWQRIHKLRPFHRRYVRGGGMIQCSDNRPHNWGWGSGSCKRCELIMDLELYHFDPAHDPKVIT